MCGDPRQSKRFDWHRWDARDAIEFRPTCSNQTSKRWNRLRLVFRDRQRQAIETIVARFGCMNECLYPLMQSIGLFEPFDHESHLLEIFA
jgi:hypothetical protein